MGMYGSRAVTLLVLISDDVINRILKLDIQTNILVYVTRCCTDLTSKVLKERTFGQSSALLKPRPAVQMCRMLLKRICLYIAQYALEIEHYANKLADFLQNSDLLGWVKRSVIEVVQISIFLMNLVT